MAYGKSMVVFIMKMVKRFLTWMHEDARYVAIYLGIIVVIGALFLWGGSISPIDRYMQGRGSGSGNRFLPKNSYEHMAVQGATHFVYVSDKIAGNRQYQKMLGSKICTEYKHYHYCEVYMWKNKSAIKVQLPVIRGPNLLGLYKQKNGKQTLRKLEKSWDDM